MPAFLVLTGSGVLFYVVVLLALYRDGRRRLSQSVSVDEFELGTVAENTPNWAIAGAKRRRSAA